MNAQCYAKDCNLPKGHDAGSDFFVSVRRGKDWRTLLGPNPTHHDAIAQVDRGRKLATDADPSTWFDSFGTCRIDGGSGVVGIFGL